MILNDVRVKIHHKNSFIPKYRGRDTSFLLSAIQRHDEEASHLCVESLLMIINPNELIRELGNDVAHVATAAKARYDGTLERSWKVFLPSIQKGVWW
jgi:hypothetical protein